MATSDDWAIQVSLKHGPNFQYLTNVRGYTATEIKEHLAHLAEHAAGIDAAIAGFVGLGAVRDQPTAEPEQEQYGSRYGGGGKKTLRERDGEMCEPHRLPMRYKSGVSGKGNKYELLECTSRQNPCDAIWPDKA